MTVLASLTRKTKKGTVYWDFIQDNDKFFAQSMESKKTIRAKDLDELRSIYRKFLNWNFQPSK